MQNTLGIDHSQNIQNVIIISYFTSSLKIFLTSKPQDASCWNFFVTRAKNQIKEILEH